MEIHPTTFTLEHIPKTLSPTGNITSAPKDFAVYVSEPRPGSPLPSVPEPPSDEPRKGCRHKSVSPAPVPPSVL